MNTEGVNGLGFAMSDFGESRNTTSQIRNILGVSFNLRVTIKNKKVF